MTVIFKVAQSFGSRDSIYIFNVLFNKIFQVLKFVQMNRNFYNPKLANLIPKYK